MILRPKPGQYERPSAVRGLFQFTAHALVVTAVTLGYWQGLGPAHLSDVKQSRRQLASEPARAQTQDSAPAVDPAQDPTQAGAASENPEDLLKLYRHVNAVQKFPPLPEGWRWTYEGNQLNPTAAYDNNSMLGFVAKPVDKGTDFIPLSPRMRDKLSDEMFVTRLYEYKGGDEALKSVLGGAKRHELELVYDSKTGRGPGIAINNINRYDKSKLHVVEMGASMVKFYTAEAALAYWECFSTGDPFACTSFFEHVQTPEGMIGFYMFSVGSHWAGSSKYVRAMGPLSHFATLGAGMWLQSFVGRLTAPWKDLRHAWKVSPEAPCIEKGEPADDVIDPNVKDENDPKYKYCRESKRLARIARQKIFSEGIMKLQWWMDMVPDTIGMMGAVMSAQGTVSLTKNIIEKSENLRRGHRYRFVRAAVENGKKPKGRWILQLVQKAGKPALKIATAGESAQYVQAAVKSMSFVIKGGKLVSKRWLAVAVADQIIDIAVMLKWNEVWIPPIKTYFKSMGTMNDVKKSSTNFEQVLAGFFNRYGVKTNFKPVHQWGGTGMPYSFRRFKVPYPSFESDGAALEALRIASIELQKAWDQHRRVALSGAEEIYGARIAELDRLNSDLAAMNLGYAWALSGAAKNRADYMYNTSSWIERYDESWFGKSYGRTKAKVLNSIFCSDSNIDSKIAHREKLWSLIPLPFTETLQVSPIRLVNKPGLCTTDINPNQELFELPVIKDFDAVPVEFVTEKVRKWEITNFLIKQCARNKTRNLCPLNIPTPEQDVYLNERGEPRMWQHVGRDSKRSVPLPPGMVSNDPTWVASALAEYLQMIEVRRNRRLYFDVGNPKSALPELMDAVHAKIQPMRDKLVTNFNVAARGAILKGITGNTIKMNKHGHPDADLDLWFRFQTAFKNGDSGNLESIYKEIEKGWASRAPKGIVSSFIAEWKMWMNYSYAIMELVKQMKSTDYLANKSGVEEVLQEIKATLSDKIKMTQQVIGYVWPAVPAASVPPAMLDHAQETLDFWKSTVMAENFQASGEKGAGGTPPLGNNPESVKIPLNFGLVRDSTEEGSNLRLGVGSGYDVVSLAPAGPDLMYGFDTPEDVEEERDDVINDIMSKQEHAESLEMHGMEYSTE